MVYLCLCRVVLLAHLDVPLNSVGGLCVGVGGDLIYL